MVTLFSVKSALELSSLTARPPLLLGSPLHVLIYFLLLCPGHFPLMRPLSSLLMPSPPN